MALVRREGRDWGDDDYEEDYDDDYLYNTGGRAAERTMSRNGSDEMSGGSGPSYGPGKYNSPCR